MVMNDLHKMALFVSPISLLIGIILALVFNFSLTKENNMNHVWMISTFLGLFTGLMNFGFQLRGSRPSYTDSYSGKNNLMKRNVIYFFIRILVFGSILSLVVINQLTATADNPARFNIIPTAIGYFIHLIILLVVFVIFNLKREKVNE
jgi:hypothetical protein